MVLNDRDVERRMVLAERADPRSRYGEADRPLQWPDLYVVNADHRRALKLWVWCEAHGCSFHGVCQERGLRYSTARRHRRAAVERIAMLLSETRIRQA